ncbi:MAG TPA: response regulator [Cellvibrionaceae bacterium]|nr:response regulator [Cellvibrionaceae bacterium]
MSAFNKPKRIYSMLVVDDSNVIRRKIERAAEGAFFRVVASAGSGEEALIAYAKHRPELITMDITMPHMDGIACIEKLMAHNPELRILVISALADKATGIEALEKGARGFLCKPFTERQLNEALCELVEDAL